MAYEISASRASLASGRLVMPMTARAPRAVEVGLGPGGERGALHADVGAAVVVGGGADLAGLPRAVAAERRADGIAERDVGDDAALEERRGPALGAVDELVDDAPRAPGTISSLSEPTAD